MKMEEQTPTSPTLVDRAEGTGKAPFDFQDGRIQEFLQRRPQEIKQEPGEGSFQQWETQWQEFLKIVEPPPGGWGTPEVPEDPRTWEDAKTFLASYEQVAEACHWPKEEWVARLLPALSGETKQVFSSLDLRDRSDYGKVKVAFEEADVSFFEAGHPLLESERRQWGLEAKEEESEEDASLWVLVSKTFPLLDELASITTSTRMMQNLRESPPRMLTEQLPEECPQPNQTANSV
ncbi:UNVERIFIED_CONTAM: hypothetical protein K2H54_062389 [Gekko kuhli]